MGRDRGDVGHAFGQGREIEPGAADYNGAQSRGLIGLTRGRNIGRDITQPGAGGIGGLPVDVPIKCMWGACFFCSGGAGGDDAPASIHLAGIGIHDDAALLLRNLQREGRFPGGSWPGDKHGAVWRDIVKLQHGWAVVMLVCACCRGCGDYGASRF